MSDMDDMLRAIQGVNFTRKGPPAYVKLAPGDDGAGLLAVFFDHPDTYAKNVGLDGRIRSWGLYPYVPAGQRGAGFEDVPYNIMRKMHTQMIYPPLNKSTKLLRPEDQFLNAVMARRKRELKEVDLGDLTRRDYVLRIHMPNIKTSTGEDRIWRRFIVSGGMSLGVFQDKVLAPLMGWVRNFHAHILTDYRDGTLYGPKNSKSIDMMHIDNSGYAFLSEDDYCLAHMMAKVGDAIGYEYDIGDHFRHEIEVEKILLLDESSGRVQILDGSGICPAENSKGNEAWSERIETLADRTTPASKRRELLSDVNSMPNYTDRGWHRRPSFDPDYFDLAETTGAVMTALGTKLSYSPGAKMYKMPMKLEALLDDGPTFPSKRQTTREVTFAEGEEISFGFFEELKKDGRDSRRATACAACGNPNDLKACSGCGQRFYCGQACQKAHWKSTHKRECAVEKKKKTSG
ncbi:MM3350-like domain-containing protein [Roridomyces roridus]|uniref:MM3350-like domain-containing protein n=1 Tax=Roridomyces roridus TaxID=1738132 RepID=A0AAD7B4P6_9AGAR|nr:MM3350-like domain-containing protein [Roridomyces roridus]